MNRSELRGHVLAAHGRFRGRIAAVKWWHRNEIAAAARALACELEPVDFAESEAMKKLAALIEVPREERDPPVEATPSSRRIESGRYSMPPDKEGDEDLSRQMKRMRP